MIEARSALDKERLTKASRGLAKHGGRKISVFPGPTGNPAQINAQGQEVLERILNHPNKKITLESSARFGDIIDIEVAEMGGVRYDTAGTFIGFFQPNECISKYRITVISLPDREYLVSEIFYGGFQWVEIHHEGEEMKIQFYPHPNKPCWEFNLDKALEVLAKAKKRMVSLGPKN